MNPWENVGDWVANPDQIWVCGACGKTSTTKYGFNGTSQHGWDESCMMNCVLCYKEKVNGTWIAI